MKDLRLGDNLKEFSYQSFCICDGVLSRCECISQFANCANLREDLFEIFHSEGPSHESAIPTSEVEDGPEATILLGDEDIEAVKA